ncbi:Tetratricopeptide TPR_1 repeat-containing protein [Cellulophaga algicola DSM 14237]|uniref:Tetratricopeptide TPR_1 repeat-containing protein n=1 Tax=Cellulophaga algicola (strain DSM 14237 / IC166 / ACAM 630) TaxID=688270 RepID=E6XC08_CELAD|nr:MULTISPECIES: CDC27 family protein [Cellulophaga]ADV50013.1 Tetratricopeptide TPR_1 repeat-containing protein [Cellulophaga algicola DSM 14237]
MALDAEEKPSQPITKFESMLKTDDVYFFDSEDFEDIIHHYLNNGKIALAKKAIKIGLQQHPAAAELKLLQIEVFVFENKLEEAEKMLDDLQQLDQHNEEIYIQRANIFSKKDDHLGAINLLEKALDLTDDGFDIYSLLGMEYLFMDDFEMAKKSFMKCVEFDDEDYSSLYNVIYCFEFLEEYDGAILYLNKYLEDNPYSEVAWHQLGKQYFSKKMYKEALSAFDFAIISDDTFIGAYFEKGKVLEKLGLYNEAIENYETTIKIEDPTSHAYLRIGKCHEKLGNTELAKYYFYHTVHEDPLLDKGWLAITDFYYRLKNYEKAAYYINKATNIDGENPIYWKKSGKISAALHKYDEADFAFKQAIDFGNYELDTWLQWAYVVEKNKDFESAITILTQAKEFHPEDAEILFKLSGNYSLMGDLEMAKKYIAQALILNPKGLDNFQINFPNFCTTEWMQNILEQYKNASK